LKTANADSTLLLEFDDNRTLSELFGRHDSHLALIEDRLGITANPRGNQLRLTGGAQALETARKVFSSLQERLEGGHELAMGDVEGAVRLALDTGSSSGTETTGAEPAPPTIRTRKRTITARTPGQKRYIDVMGRKTMVFATGPAGTGKTYLAVAAAAAALESGLVERIILSRPAVEAGERLGFLPGDMKEKVDPYLRPLYDALYDCLPEGQVARGLEMGQIEIAPLAFMRGRTLSHAWVILDEAQNCTPMQMKMFLTRLGENARMTITGDPSQVDLPGGEASGLMDAVNLLGSIKEIAHIRFTQADVVRHELVRRIVSAYDARAGSKGTGK
jgi:phosphate starvation-inducible PhoH-like protein